MDLADKLKYLPQAPGVYIMKNSSGAIIYVGKALSLKNRVRSYFQISRNHSPKVTNLVSQVADIEYILTDSEVEALILECNLIKKHRPRYNVRLADDKSYPYVKVTLSEDYPRVFITRKVIRDGSRYYGPYTDAGALRETLRLLKKVFPLRQCRQKSLNRQKRPCLNYHIKRCLAPCQGEVGREKYLEMIKNVCLFLEGRHEELVKTLSVRMADAAENLDFEQAAELRDRIRDIEKVVEKQKIVSADHVDQDVVALAREGELSAVAVFFIRGGKLMGREHFIIDETSEMADNEILTSFVKQYYIQVEYVPRDILLPVELTEIGVINKWLEEKKSGRVYIKVPQRGEKARLVEMAQKNAAEELVQHRTREEQARTKLEGALLGLKDYLGLSRIPLRIECYDISNIQGTEPVGSMVVFVGGKPRNDLYRRFRIKTVEGPNDFASMQEVIRRRFARGTKEIDEIAAGRLDSEKAKFAEMPDLVIIDGGKGQLSAAREVMKELDVNSIAIYGLAKEHEHLFGGDSPDPVILPSNSESLYLVQRIRDEAHRFAIIYHRKLRGKRSLKSVLDDIPGVGPKRRKALVEHFRSMASLKNAAVDQLAEVPGMTRSVAEAVYEFFQQEEN
ncbi:excinuclease ABC subunit UvrC [Phosphitispora sp. TUW77]|uniref:excinuclease ABC subunit UvrC n=1 Tax=Phosphitispora sp. TUW77 TaxID=3152361 RepID=UPI003AB248F5